MTLGYITVGDIVDAIGWMGLVFVTAALIGGWFAFLRIFTDD